MKALIDYGEARPATIWGYFTAETVSDFFEEKANQCFGIRKSIMYVRVIDVEDEPMPTPWVNLPAAATMLKHSGDTIVWNSAGEKIKTEWD